MAAATKSKLRIPSTSGLANELYFASHKPDGDNERTPPVLMRNKRRSPHLNIVPFDGPTNTRRPISSPARSTTYVLQQHHRINTNIPHKQPSSPAQRQHQSPSITPMTLNKTRQTQQQQRIFSNHERLPIQSPATVDSSTLTPRTQIALTPRRTSPALKTTPTKTTTFTSRSPRVSIPENLLMNINHLIIFFFFSLSLNHLDPYDSTYSSFSSNSCNSTAFTPCFTSSSTFYTNNSTNNLLPCDLE